MSEEQALQTTEKPNDAFWIKLASDANTASSNFFDANIRSRMIKDIRQFQSQHPEGSKYFTDSYRLKSKLFRPKTRSAIRKDEAMAAGAFFSTEDVVSCQPVDKDDPEQIDSAKFQQALLQIRLTRQHPYGLPWFLTCQGAYQESEAVGIVASFQQWKYNKKKKIDRADITLLPPENVRFDPAADWRDVVNTSPYLIIYWPMYLKDVRARMFPGRDGDEPKWRYYPDGTILSASKTSDTMRQARENNGTDSKQVNSANNDFTIVWVHQNIIEVEGFDIFYYTLGDTKLLSDPAMVEDEYPQGRPVTVGFSIVEAHKAYKSSECELSRDIQTEINDVANLRIDNVKLRLNKRYFAKRGKNIDLRSLTRNSPASVTLMDEPNSDVKVVTTDDATASSYQEQDRLNLDFDDLMGSFSGSSVATNRQLNETVGGMELLNSSADQVSEYKLRTFVETWVEPTLRQILILEQTHENDEKILKAAAMTAGIPLEKVTLALLTNEVLLGVNVGIGAINPQMQLRRFVAAMKLLSEILGPDFLKRQLSPGEREIVKEVFGKSGYRDGSRFLIPQQEEQEQEDPRLVQAVQMIEQLQQALDAKHPPEVVQAQVEKLLAEAGKIREETELKRVETTNKRVESLFGAMNTAQTAVTVPGVAPVADAIARSAGFEDQDGGDSLPRTERLLLPEEATIDKNTSPMSPANPQRGMMTGIESGRQAELVSD